MSEMCDEHGIRPEAVDALQAQVAALTAENAKLRDELEAEEQANKLAAHSVQDAYEREAAALRLDLARATAERDGLRAQVDRAGDILGVADRYDSVREIVNALDEALTPDAVPSSTPTEETKPEPGRKR